MRILIVDDDITLIEGYKEFLEREGHTVTTVINGEMARVAVEMAGTTPAYDVVVCDWNFGLYDHRNGGEIIADLRDQNGPARYIIWSGLNRTVPDGVEFHSKDRDIRAILTEEP